MTTIFINAQVITPYRTLDPGYVVVAGKTIQDVGAGSPPVEPHAEDRVIDLAGHLLTPGFIDMHLHGGGGADCVEGGETLQSLETISRQHAQGGTTAYLPTTRAIPIPEIYAFLDGYYAYRERLRAGPLGADPIGVHIEGPYLEPAQAGAQPRGPMKPPDPEEYEPLLDACPPICRMTAAPELPGGLALGRALRRRGFVASIGHAQPSAAETCVAQENGYTLLTHFYSGMQGVTRQSAYRIAGLVEAGYLYDFLALELIADGHHLPGELLQLAYKVKGPDRIALVTDANRAAGHGDGEYSWGGRTILVENGVAKLPDRSAFVGSVALMNQLVRNMVELADVPLREAVQMATITPARILRIDGTKGAIAAGMDADLTVLDPALEVHMTMVGGTIVYNRRAKEEFGIQEADRESIGNL